jgi:hypothetical protein
MDKIFAREAKKLLRRLTQKGAYLKRAEDSYELWNSRAKNPLESISESFCHTLLRHDFVKQSNDDLILSDGGWSFLRRQAHPDDAFRRQHFSIAQHKNHKGETYEVNMNENPLFWLRSRKGPDGKAIISQSQMEAGCRLQSDFFSATAQPKLVLDLSQPYLGKQTRGFEGAPMTDRAMDARARMNAALNMLGPGLADIALEVCCYMQGLESAEKHIGWPRRAGKVVLQIALQRLVVFYKIS